MYGVSTPLVPLTDKNIYKYIIVHLYRKKAHVERRQMVVATIFKKQVDHLVFF